MAVILTLQDLLDQVNDFNQNYNVTTIDLGNKTRAINRAIEFVQQRLGLPSDRQIQTFNFYEDTAFYALDEGYSDMIGLYYNTTNGNVVANNNLAGFRWFPEEDTNILRRSGEITRQNQFAFTTINGSNQLLMKGRNTRSSFLINPFNSLVGVSFSSSITGAAVDPNIYETDGASIVFNVGASEATSTITLSGTWDIRQLLNTDAAYRLWLDFPTGVGTNIFSSIGIRLQSSTGNYYDVTTTLDYLGAAWASNGWSKLGFDLSDVVTTGNPVASTITSIIIRLNHAGGFSPVTAMRINRLYVVQPDVMDFVYYSAYKGTDTTGATRKVILTSADDILSFGAFAPDLIYPIALKAALILWPQLRADPTFYPIYQTDFKDTITLYGKRYPRKRNPVASSTQLAR